MSESPKGNSNDFAKKVQRRLSRGKEKVLQKLGKAVETKDDQFELFLHQFNDQHTDGNRMYKDLRAYISAVRDMREASRRLFQSLFDVYESDWVGEDDLGAIVEGEDLLWNDYEVKTLDQAVRTMESYVAQFPDVREKIAKRGRKLVDYDSSRHHLEALQAAKKRDDVKIQKAEEEKSEALSVYEGINSELKEELPVLYDSRVGCYVAVFSAISNLRDIFYKEMSTLNLDLENVIKELQAQHPDKVFAVRGMQRYGSLKRRTLMSPKAWKASFSEFHWTYSPRPGQRSSFRSPDKPRHSTLSREGSTLSGSSQSVPVVNLLPESRDGGAEANRSLPPQESATGGEPKVEGGQVEEESEPPAAADAQEGGEKAPPSDSSSELNSLCDSESLDVQLSTVDNGPLHIQEDDQDHHGPTTLDLPKANGPEIGDVTGLGSDATDLSSAHKDSSVEKEAPVDSKTTEV